MMPNSPSLGRYPPEDIAGKYVGFRYQVARAARHR